jgi:hypothetical protein
LYFATLHPQSSHPSLFCFPEGSYLPHLYRLLLLKPFVRNSVVCLIVSRRSTICLSFCSYSSPSLNALLRHCEPLTFEDNSYRSMPRALSFHMCNIRCWQLQRQSCWAYHRRIQSKC